MSAEKLIPQLVEPVDRPLNDLREPGNKQQKMEIILLMLILSVINICQIGNCLKCVKRNAKRQDQSCTKQTPFLSREQITDLKRCQHAKVDHQNDNQHKPFLSDIFLFDRFLFFFCDPFSFLLLFSFFI